MFGKLLNVVGLLTLVKFAAAAFSNSLPSCNSPSVNTDATLNTTVKYCIDNNNKIHDYGEGGATDAGILPKGVYVFDHTSQLALQLGTSGSIGSSTDNLILYQCGGDKVCQQTTGYVQIGTDTWFYVKEGGSGSTTPNASVTDNDDCDGTDEIGSLIKYSSNAVHLCLTTAKSVAAAAIGDYLVVDSVTATNSPFAQNNLIITTDEYFIVDKLLAADDYCVDNDSKIVTGRKTNYCDNRTNDCDDYMKCEDGACTTVTIDPRSTEEPGECNPATNAKDCNEGYYILDNSNTFVTAVSDANINKVYHCQDKTSCTDVTSSIVGYLKNADTTNASTIPYIKCTHAHQCSSIAQPGANSCSTSGSGSLIYNEKYKLCIDGTNSVELDSATSYLVSAHTTDGTFIASTSKSDFVIVAVDGKGSATLTTQASGNYYIADASKALLTAVDKAETTGTLYKSDGSTCVADTTTIGYLKNAASDDDNVPYIECSATETQQTIDADTVDTNACKAIAKPSGTKVVGALINDGDYKLYINDSSAVAVGASAAKYLVDAHTASAFVKTAVEEGYYVVVEIDTDGNIIRRPQTGRKYIYAVTASKQVYDKGETDQVSNMCQDGTLKTGSSEYVLNKTNGDLVDFYKENNAN